MQQIVIYWLSVVPQHVSGVFTPIIRRSDCVSLRMVFCPVVAVVMLESRVARCVHCVEDVASKEDVGDTGESGGKMCALCGGCCK